MIDPAEVAKLAQMDQVTAAFGTWADVLRSAQLALMRRGVSEEAALGIAADWMLLIIGAVTGGQDA